MDGWKEGPVNPAGPADECAWRTPYICKEKEHYRPDLTDGIFAIIAFIIGYLFARWVFFSWKGWGVAGFTTLYCAAVTAYMGIKGAPMKREGIFWLIVTWLTGLSFALWSGRSLEAVRSLFLLSTAVYAPIGLNGTSIEGKTGNMLILDGLNAVFVIPFRNFLNQYQSLRVFKGEKKSRISGQLSVLLGVGISLLGLFVLVPLLRSADSGGFSRILDSVFRVFSFSNKAVLKWFFYLLLSIPMAAYIYGLLSGCVHKKGWNTFKKEAAIDTVNALRIVPKGTILTVLGILCGVYLTFLLSQTPYFFSGFSGKRPEGWLVYSEYARRGFFELCQIAAINLGVLAAANLLSVNHRNAWKALKVFNVVLMLMTLLFIATAFSKMALYIHAYGLSMPRLLPCVFMAFMAIVCCGVILLQKWTFSIVRFAAFTGAVMLCFLIVSDPDGLVVRYNTGRFLNGSLQGYDTEILYRAGPAGVVPALDVFAVTEDEEQKANLITYFKDQLSAAEQARDAPGYDLQSERARRAILSSQAYLKP